MKNKDYMVDEISFEKLIETPLQHKLLIIFLTILIAIFAIVYIYFQPNIYKATSTLEISAKKANPSVNDLLATALSQSSQNVDTEMEILKSHFVSKMALKKVDFINHYYYVDNYRKIEFYKNAPFKVELKKGYGVKFTICPRKDGKFTLEVKKKGEANFEKEIEFNQWVKTSYFEIKVDKIADFKHKQYIFVAEKLKTVLNELDKNLKVKQASPKSSIIVISFEDNIAKRAKAYVDALAKAYIKQSIERKTKQATKRISFIDEQLKTITKNLKDSEDKLENYKKKTNIINLSTKAKSVVERSAKLEAQLTTISLEREVVQTLYNQVKNGVGLENISIVGMGADGGSLISMVQQLQNAIIKKKMLLQEYTNAHPEVIKVTSSIIQLKRSILRNIKNMLRLLNKRESFAKESLKNENKIISKLPKSEKVLTNLKRHFLVNEKIYSYLLEKRSESSIVKASTISSNRIIDSAEVADKPVKPRKKLIVLGGALIGFILGVILAYIKDLTNDKIEDKEDIEKVTTIPIIGNIPHIKSNYSAIAVLDSPKSVLSESFRSLRTNLQFMARSENKVISITSTIAGEGKTFTSVNLATIISLTGQKTIVINLDMRKPTLHDKFGLSNYKGMSTYLSGKSLLYEIIQPSQYENLDVITSGPIPPNPSELINSRAFKDLIERLKAVYEVIILDTPPIGIVADARVIMDISDVNIYILRENYSKKVFVNNIDKLKEEGIRGLGIVYNDIEIKKDGYGYGYYT